jgi:stage V sporulation protein B
LTITLIVMAATGLALTIALARRLGLASFAPRGGGRVAKEAVRTGLKLHVSSIALYLNLQIDLLFVAAMTDTRSAGLYSLSATLAAGVFLATSTLGLSALQTQTDAEEAVARAYTIEFTRQAFAISLIIATAAALLAYPFILLVYGDEWVASVPSFVVLTVAAVGLGIEAPTRNLLIRIGRPGAISIAAALALGVNVAVNLALIPVIGIVGAALASVLSYWTAALLGLWLLRRVAGIPMRRVLERPDLAQGANRIVQVFRKTPRSETSRRPELPPL